jgi:hypothetical protein
MKSITEDGRAELTDVPPGDYVIEAVWPVRTLGQPHLPRASTIVLATADSIVERGSIIVRVTGDDVTGLVLRMNKGHRVTGRLVDHSGRAIERRGIRISATAIGDSQSESPEQRTAVTGEDGSFVFEHLSGRQLLRVNQPDANGPSVVTRIMAGGADVTDDGLDVLADTVVDVVIDVPTELSGIVTTRSGARLAAVFVLVFSENAARWTLPNSRYVRVVQTTTRGEFRLSGLPAGDYYVSVPGGMLTLATGTATPAVGDLTTLIPGATRVSLADAETQAIRLVID